MTAGPASADLRAVLGRSGEVGRDLLAVDWEATPLGPLETWPSSLSTMVRMLLTSRFAMWIAWGSELTFFCNDAYRSDTLGKKYPWALGRPAREVWAEIWPDISPRIETVLSTGQATWDEALMLFLERSGYREETYHTFSYSPLPDDHGVVAGMLCVVSEETERVIGERRMTTLRELASANSAVGGEREFLDASAERLRANPHSLPFTLVYLFDEGHTAHLACSTGMPEGHPAAPAVIHDDADALWPVAVAAAGRSAVGDLTDPRYAALPSGAWEDAPKRGLVVPLAQPGHVRPYGFLVVGLNPYRPLDEAYRTFVELIAQHLAAGIVTSRSYETERRRAEQLEELDRAKTAFFSNVSHEFRTPLTLMLGPLQDALAGHRSLDATQLELVHRNALRLLKLVNALLDFSRAEAGRMRAQFRPTDVAKLTAELAGTFRDATTRAGLELVVDTEPAPQCVYLDSDLWERIVLNLVSNAFKATLSGRITVQCRQDGDAVQLTVADTGTGIPQDEVARLFRRFHRVTNAEARSYEGTGIGLALVKELTELHGGEVAVSSVVGEGSRFTVRVPLGAAHLPADQVHEDRMAPATSIAPLFVEEAVSWVAGSDDHYDVGGPEELAPGPGGRADGSAPRVLIADDNPDLRRYLTRLLSAHFEVETANDGTAALAVARERPPDLLITDVMMPGLDGYGLLTALRALPETRELPVIMLSARTGEEAAIEGLRAGADDYLPKPFSGRELVARVRAHLELAGVRRRAAAEVRTERLRLEQTLQQLPAGVLLAEAPSGRIVFANDQAAGILGHPLADAKLDESRSFRGFTLAHEPLPADRWPLARAIKRHETVQDEDMLYETGSGRRIIVRASAAPIRDEHGDVFAGVVVFQDVGERVRTERLLSAQRDILALIAQGEPLSQTLATIVRCVETLSEFEARGSIMLCSDDGRRLEHGAAPSLPGAFNRTIDRIEIGPSFATCGAAAHRGETVISADTSSDPLWSDYRELVAEHRLRAGWSTPIHADDGELVGVLTVYYDEPREPAHEDRRVVDLLTRTAAVAIGRARDAHQRARQLNELQSSLLPHTLPEVPGLRAAVSFHPGDRGLEVGGDFYDLFSLSHDAWGVVIGDVCGHGAEAAAVTALTRHTTRAAARLEQQPARVLSVVNDALCHSDYERFCTAVYARLEPGEDRLRVRLASAGHPPPLIRRAGGEIETLRRHGPLLGVFAEPSFPELTVELAHGDTLLLYTDGLIERNPRVPGDAGLRSLLASLPAGRVEELVGAVERRALGDPPAALFDDTALLAIQATAHTAADGAEAARKVTRGLAMTGRGVSA